MLKSRRSRLKCPHGHAVWGGFRTTRLRRKHLRQCLECGSHFTPDDGFNRMRYPKEIIVRALDLHRQGLSLRKVSTFLLQHHQVRVSDVAILKWANKYERSRSYFRWVRRRRSGWA